MRSTAKLLESFDTLKPEVQQQVRDSMREYAKPDGPLQQAAAAMKGVSDFPWEVEAPTTKLPNPTATPQPTKSAQATKAISAQSSRVITSTSAKTISATTSSSSTAPSPTAQVLPYYIATKWDTPVELFENFVKELDDGIGKAELLDYRQTYETNLTSARADEIKAKYPFLLIVYADVVNPKDLESDAEEFHAIHRARGQQLASTALETDRKLIENPTFPLADSILPRAPITGGENAPYWKKMISSPFRQPPLRPTAEDPPYAADDSGGRGTTIYVLDDGFDINSPVSFGKSLI
jgi:subtilisin family serine protease